MAHHDHASDQKAGAGMRRDPGAHLTRAEKAMLHTRDAHVRIRDHYESIEDDWNIRIEDSGEAVTKARYRSMLRAEREGDGDMGRAWRLYQKVRRVLARRIQQCAELKRRYYDDRDMGTGG